MIFAPFKHSRFLRCSYGASIASAKNSSSFNIFSTSTIMFFKYWNCHHITNNMIYEINLNTSNSTSLISIYSTTKLQRSYLWEKFQEVFVMLVIVLLRWRFFVDVMFHLSLSYCQVYRYKHLPILYFHPSSLQSDLWHFHFNVFWIFNLSRVLRFWAKDCYWQALLALLFVT